MIKLDSMVNVVTQMTDHIRSANSSIDEMMGKMKKYNYERLLISPKLDEEKTCEKSSTETKELPLIAVKMGEHVDQSKNEKDKKLSQIDRMELILNAIDDDNGAVQFFQSTLYRDFHSNDKERIMKHIREETQIKKKLAVENESLKISLEQMENMANLVMEKYMERSYQNVTIMKKMSQRIKSLEHQLLLEKQSNEEKYAEAIKVIVSARNADELAEKRYEQAAKHIDKLTEQNDELRRIIAEMINIPEKQKYIISDLDTEMTNVATNTSTHNFSLSQVTTTNISPDTKCNNLNGESHILKNGVNHYEESMDQEVKNEIEEQINEKQIIEHDRNGEVINEVINEVEMEINENVSEKFELNGNSLDHEEIEIQIRHDNYDLPIDHIKLSETSTDYDVKDENRSETFLNNFHEHSTPNDAQSTKLILNDIEPSSTNC
ncbi:hypothetical protein SNEBB_007781 [Seison nebaliae]|nr:hypothetical protein SNEBB_007781 [Seison nebaliae]